MTLEERTEKIRATRHAYYLKHKEKMKAYSKEWYSKHPEKWREYQKRHPEKRRQYQNTYYQKNKEKILAYQKEWRKAHPDKFKAYREKSLQNQLLGIAAKRPKRQKPAKNFDTEKLAHIFKDPATAAHYKKVIQLNEQAQKCAL